MIQWRAGDRVTLTADAQAKLGDKSGRIGTVRGTVGSCVNIGWDGEKCNSLYHGSLIQPAQQKAA